MTALLYVDEYAPADLQDGLFGAQRGTPPGTACGSNPGDDPDHEHASPSSLCAEQTCPTCLHALDGTGFCDCCGIQGAA